ncbi:MFS transporter [Thermovenabulum sp.]|uniref:MFS transporter n=1 Tax=Thermovenabulum sp. TaxID=3100335 RepID=UPI003C7EB866
MKKENLKRYFQFLLVVLAAGSIYPLIYLRTAYQETILEVFGISLAQLNTIFSALGFAYLVGYLPSGLLSDKFSAKWLLVISLLGVGAGGLWFAQIPDYQSVVIIFIIWGLFSVFTFWSSHMKLVKLLAEEGEEGRFFGVLDGGRGLVEAVLAAIAIFIFSQIMKTGDKRAALIGVIYMYTIVLFVVGLLVAIFVKPENKANTANENRQPFKLVDVLDVLKNKRVYLHGAIIFMCYAVTWAVYYLGGFLETNIGVGPVVVGTVMTIVLWMRPVGGTAAGFLADKFGKRNIVRLALLGASICLILISILPSGLVKPVFYVLVILTGLFIYSIRGTYWSLIADSKVDNRIVGVAIGLVSLIGYLPDIILPTFNSFLFRVFGDNAGYNAYFISTAIIGFIGIILVTIFDKVVKKEDCA